MRARTDVVVIGVIVLLAATGGSKAVSTVIPGHHHAAAPSPAPVAGPGEGEFLTAVLRNLGAPATNANLTSLAGWVQRETPWPPVAAFNPLNSTQYESGSTVYNNITLSDGQVIHVWNYPDAETGAAATAATIGNGHYPQIVDALTSGEGLCNDVAAASEFLTWSGNGYSGPVCN